MKAICAFSSDFRELYKGDIYRALALPEGHIIHFRYKKKYVDENLLNQSKDIIGRDVIIFFTQGNIEENHNELLNISIRKARLVNCELSKNTGVFHVYMKLLNFCNAVIDTGNSTEKSPPNKFLTELNYTESSEENNWQSRINIISDYFPDLTFINVNEIQKTRFLRSNKKINLKYTNNKKSCFYSLKHGGKYIANLSVGNPKGTNTGIKLSYSEDDMIVNCAPNPLTVSAQYDDFSIPMSPKTLPVQKQMSLMVFSPTNMENEEDSKYNQYVTNIELNLSLKFTKALLFGFLAALALYAISLSQSTSPEDIAPSILEIITSGILFILSTGFLFYLFNKK